MRRIRMLRRRSLGAAIAVAMLLALLPGMGTGVAGPLGPRMLNARIPVDPEDGKPVSLAARVFLPEEPGPHPTLLYVTPYSASLNRGARSIYGHVGQDTRANWFTGFSGRRRADGFEHVYAYVVVDVRGTGASDGTFCLFCEQEQKDMYEVINWITRQDWSDKENVGMLGTSYAGISALLAAAQGHPALKAITPGLSYADLYREEAWHNGMLNALSVTEWSTYQDGVSNGAAVDEQQEQTDPGSSGDRLLDRAQGRAAACGPALERKPTDGCFPLLDVLARPYDDDWYRERAVYPKYDQITVPTLLRGGWSDVFSRGILWNFRGIASEHKKLLMVPWGHWANTGVQHSMLPFHAYADLNNPHAGDFPNINQLWLDLEDWWFDRFLYGDQMPPEGPRTRLENNKVDLDELVHYYDANTGKLKNTSAFPPEGSGIETFYLSGETSDASQLERDDTLRKGTLSDGAVTDDSTAAAHSYVYRPAYGAADAFGKWGAVGLQPRAHVDQRADETQALTYTTAPLQKDLELAGPMELRFFAITTAEDMDWVVKVTDVSPEDECRGTDTSGADRNTPNDCSKLITSGYLKASHYEVDEGRSLPAEPWILNERSLPVKDELIEYRIDIWPTAWTIKAGNQLRIAIASSDVPNHPASPYPGENTIFHDAEHQSHLLVTVAGNLSQVELNASNSAPSGQHSDEAMFEARLTDSKGDPLGGRELNFELLGTESTRSFTATTDVDGIGRVTPLLEEKPGPYELTVRFAGDEHYAGITDTVPFVVDKEDTDLELTVEGDDETKTVVARLSDADSPSRGIADRIIQLYSDSELIGSSQTDADGVARFALPPGHRGANRTYEVVFDGDDFYLGSSQDRPGKDGGGSNGGGVSREAREGYAGQQLLL